MANEAVILELMGQPKGRPVRFTISGGQAIAKGTIMTISGANGEARPSQELEEAFAGITSTEVVAAEGDTSVGCWTCGKFDIKTGVAISEGTMVIVSGANTMKPALAVDLLSGAVMGKCLENASANETAQVLVGVY